MNQFSKGELIMTTNILKSLSLSVIPTMQRMSPEQHRRAKLISKLTEQKVIAQADLDGCEHAIMRRKWVKNEQGEKVLINAPKRIKRWWMTDADGNCVLIIRYSNRVIELEKGKAAIIVGKPDNLIPTIDAVIAAVNAGELDGHLAQMGLARPLHKAAK